MRKFLLILCALLGTIGAWADVTVTIVDGTQNPCGTLNERNGAKTTLTSYVAAGYAGVVITAGVFDQATWLSSRCLAIKPSAAKTAEKVTISAPSGYNIVGYSIECFTVSPANCPYYIDTNAEYTGSLVPGSKTTYSVSNIETSSTYFWLYANAESVGNWLGVSSFQVYLKPDFQAVNVTYDLYESDGTTKVDSKTVEQEVNSEVSIPVSFMYNYYYNYATEGTIGTEDCTIKVTRTLKNANIVNPLTGLSNNKSYYIKTREEKRSALSTYTVEGTTYLASPVKTTLGIEPKKFAILNYEGNKYLYSVEDKKFVTYNNNEKAPLADVFTGTGDAITFVATTAPLYQLRFNNSANQIINSSANYAYGVVFNSWGANSNQWDDGCLYTIEEADDFDPDPVIAYLDDYFHGATAFNAAIASLESYNYGSAYGQYSFTGAYAGYDASIVDDLKTEGYTAENLELAQNLLDATLLNTPTAGFYRLKNVATGKYLTATAITGWNSETKGVFANGDASDAATVIELRQKADGLYMFNQDCGFGWTVAGATVGKGLAWITTNPDKYVNWFGGTAAGQIGFAICYGNGTGNYASYLKKGIYTAADEDAVIGGTDYTVDAAQWIVEDATGIDVTITDAGYATLYVPFAVEIPEGVEAKKGTIGSNDKEKWLSLSNIDGTIPASTPVVLKGKPGTYTFNITADVDAIEGNALSGTYLSKAVGENTYLMAKPADKEVGFYLAESGNIPANKAYLQGDGTGPLVKAFFFDAEDATAIANVNVNDNNNQAAIYNVAGQRLSKMQKGINIVNGKKVLK